jgi:hypothetical protein
MKVKIKFGKRYIKTYTVYSVGVRNQKLLCLWNIFRSCKLLCIILIAVTICNKDIVYYSLSMYVCTKIKCSQSYYLYFIGRGRSRVTLRHGLMCSYAFALCKYF